MREISKRGSDSKAQRSASKPKGKPKPKPRANADVAVVPSKRRFTRRRIIIASVLCISIILSSFFVYLAFFIPRGICLSV